MSSKSTSAVYSHYVYFYASSSYGLVVARLHYWGVESTAERERRLERRCDLRRLRVSGELAEAREGRLEHRRELRQLRVSGENGRS